MTLSKKEKILQAIETRLATIISGNKPKPDCDYIYQNTVGYVDRQFLQFDIDEVLQHAKPWIILNNNAESLEPRPGGLFISTMSITVIGFVEASKTTPNLDSIMNSLQADIMACMLSDESLTGLADYLEPRDMVTANELVWPHGGFAFTFEIVYTFSGLNFQGS